MRGSHYSNSLFEKAAAIIQLDRVFKFYRTEGHIKIVLDHASIVFETGRSYALLGVNGAGKSTTLRLIAGTELPNSGRVRRSVRVSWPLGFAGGFHHLMTGRDNVKFVARAYGADVRKVLTFRGRFFRIGRLHGRSGKDIFVWYDGTFGIWSFNGH